MSPIPSGAPIFNNLKKYRGRKFIIRQVVNDVKTRLRQEIRCAKSAENLEAVNLAKIFNAKYWESLNNFLGKIDAEFDLDHVAQYCRVMGADQCEFNI